jgi:hypothetical protein
MEEIWFRNRQQWAAAASSDTVMGNTVCSVEKGERAKKRWEDDIRFSLTELQGWLTLDVGERLFL